MQATPFNNQLVLLGISPANHQVTIGRNEPKKLFKPKQLASLVDASVGLHLLQKFLGFALCRLERLLTRLQRFLLFQRRLFLLSVVLASILERTYVTSRNTIDIWVFATQKTNLILNRYQPIGKMRFCRRPLHLTIETVRFGTGRPISTWHDWFPVSNFWSHKPLCHLCL